MRNVSRDYFATVGASVHEGRFFSAADQASKLPVAIINEPFANGDCELKEAASDRTRLRRPEISSRYSVRNATSGLTRVARIAGNKHAMAPVTPSTTETAVRVQGSFGPMPNKKRRSS